uniref:Trk system potassium uptake protein n=2 Tax=unclassified Candidatus Kentrum TaxID=2643149 RepID=A0A451AE46_9GAMM|nr:MAG: trk system potassium uptake protein TrkH [Candidatus Kentron sp. LPFa]VFK64281.1 MAG: trk system potassium uptake protein TrkH [Candidatus Kentron sp. UNK]VFK71048.1 MAG: trk system potassium uptake protein TrkH [Candidatus Kentron sp. UNK]
MRFAVVSKILGLLLTVFSITMLPPVAVSLWYADGEAGSFLMAFLLIFLSGLIFWLPVRGIHQELRLRDGFVVVLLFWVSLTLSGAVPLMLAENPHMSLTNAFFESVSGLTTTGATVMTGIDDLPPSVQFYRQLLQWLGGMGVIVLAVAILPMLGIGGMQLYRAETPGPVKDSKLTPRITETAKALWYIYLGLTVLCTVGYQLAGMSLFDAVCHSFATISIGGFSTHDASLGYFDSTLIEMVAVVFMIISAINFSLHFTAWRGRTLRPYFRDSEARAFLIFLLTISVITGGYLYFSSTFENAGDALRDGVFQAISISTTTGFTTASYHAWPSFLPVLLLFASFMGGCAGSTGGGLKVIRVLLLFKQGMREIARLIHPNALVPIKIGATVLPPRVVEAIWGFFGWYVVTFASMLLALMATGLDQVTAFSAVAACMNNMGPGLGDVSAHYDSISDAAKWILCLAMLLGRLEIFTLLVILSPSFWRT